MTPHAIDRAKLSEGTLGGSSLVLDFLFALFAMAGIIAAGLLIEMELYR